MVEEGVNQYARTVPYGKAWAVIAIDWKAPNVLEWCEMEADARRVAEAYDQLALRATAVPYGHPLIKEEK